MKVLLLLDERWDSGITQSALDLAEELRDRGHLATLLLRARKKPEALSQGRGLPVLAFSHPWWEANRLARWMREQKIELLHAFNGTTHALGVWLKTRGLLSRQVPIVRSRLDARPFRLRWGGRWLYRHTDFVLFAQEALRQDFLAGFPYPIALTQTVYPGIEAPAPPPWPSEKPFRVGLLARLDPVKGHRHFLQAASLVAGRLPLQFRLAGPEANLRWADIKRQARKLRLDSQVKFDGYVSQPFSWMRGCHLGVIASVGSEAVSRVAVEWMASSRPLLATRVGCLPELVRPRQTGFLIAPGSCEQMAFHILDAFARPQDLKEMGGRAYRFYRERLSRRHYGDQVEQVYRHVL
ncbi:MAG: glycosyltransferase family 4 protein [Elusimicrobia bacterium]|nr:glycosyltransferase family 4 protein [Elusimicrobiota bacterium]